MTATGTAPQGRMKKAEACAAAATGFLRMSKDAVTQGKRGREVIILKDQLLKG